MGVCPSGWLVARLPESYPKSFTVFVCLSAYMQLGALYWEDREFGCLLLQGGEECQVLRRISEWELLDHRD